MNNHKIFLSFRQNLIEYQVTYQIINTEKFFIAFRIKERRKLFSKFPPFNLTHSQTTQISPFTRQTLPSLPLLSV